MKKITTKKEVIDIMVDMITKRQMHNFWVHGVGFCAICGELKKRCECKEFTPVEPCNDEKCYNK